jgi:hypothetical protein
VLFSNAYPAISPLIVSRPNEDAIRNKDELAGVRALRSVITTLFISTPQEAVNHIVRVGVEARDRPLGVDGRGLGALPCPSARAGGIEFLEFAKSCRSYRLLIIKSLWGM